MAVLDLSARNVLVDSWFPANPDSCRLGHLKTILAELLLIRGLGVLKPTGSCEAIIAIRITSAQC